MTHVSSVASRPWVSLGQGMQDVTVETISLFISAE